jgi:alginate O-acetyltransferase complex protein AlgJ
MTSSKTLTLTRLGAALSLCALGAVAQAQDKPPGVVGKNGWIFYQHEFVRIPAEADVSVDLIARISKVLEANGTTLMVALAPIKARIYEEHLPPSHTMTADHKGDYSRLLARFKAGGVHTADINSAFLNSPKRTGEFPLYFLRDTHWSATGALLAAETVRDAIQANPATQKALAQTPESKQTILWATQKFPMEGDLIQQLPAGSPTFEKELITAFEVRKAAAASLTGNGSSGVALLGSSYTADWTHFPKAMGFALQRDVPSIAITADRGQWVGLETYLRNDAFQTSRPKLLIWEMPERDLKAPPNMPYREARYVLDNDEWFARVSALTQRSCAGSGNQASISGGKLAAAKNATETTATGSAAQDFVELSLTQASNNQEYLSAKLLTNGSKTVTVELTGPGATTRKYALDTAGDEQEHAFAIPLFAKGKGFTKIKLYPGNTKGFALKNPEVCKQPSAS